MASFGAVHPSPHAPSVLPFPLSVCPSLCSVFHYGEDRSISESRAFTAIFTLMHFLILFPPPTLPFLFGRASRRLASPASRSGAWLRRVLCVQQAFAALNLWLVHHRGLLTTHACLPACMPQRCEWKRLRSHSNCELKLYDWPAFSV